MLRMEVLRLTPSAAEASFAEALVVSRLSRVRVEGAYDVSSMSWLLIEFAVERRWRNLPTGDALDVHDFHRDFLGAVE